ncbi:MAG: hypothetical protein HYW33_00240 [Candidatus Blackburnbacteria bacterium]|nr:hypothetical protein [Candidatus Blackburnbacteria bacterium]
MLPKVLVIAVLVVVAAIGLGSFFRKQAGPAPWESSKTPCPNPLVLQTPVDLNKVTSILYPGQVRGGDFKPHGGFRFDNSKVDEIEVKAPMDAQLEDASRYIEQGEVQYMFDFQTSCGIRFRFDHLLVLTPQFAEASRNLPNPKEHDSRTTRVNPPISVKKGEVIATAVGFGKNNNVFVDFGVYDMRGKIFQGPRQNAVCWFDLLPASDSAKVKSLPPADSVSGSKSTLCKP